MKGYLYRGRHRVPSTTRRRAAALAAATALPMIGAVGTANAAESPDWDPIIACESGGNPRAQNPSSSASGLFQFIDSTWERYGGETERAKDASVSHQYEVANRAHAREGYAPWNASKSCWDDEIGKSSKTSPKKVTETKSETPVVVEKPIGSPTPGGEGGYIVQPGDTLTGIAAVHGTDWKTVYDANRDVVEHSDLIFPGEVLKV